MKACILFTLVVLMTFTLSAQQAAPYKYPDAKKADQVDDFFGTKVADPYRWLENSDAPDTRAWIDAENTITFAYLEQIPERARLKDRLTKLWNYERYGVPSREGAWYVFSRNTGLQKQAVIYKTKSLEAAPDVLLDPNTWS
ncbi:MAG: S9 family peptidase, partial [Acidobacteria bacterium]|nr:S9 family peptidase [Acidobacteriota bacterium]